jgi:hypothetical protein
MEKYNIGRKGFDLLLEELLDSPFEVIIDRDSNRLKDGENIRKAFFTENGVSGMFIDHEISVLEVILALAIRIDQEYTGNPRNPHPELIFWELLGNLGLDKFDNIHFNSDIIYEILGIFINREYDFNGNGGLFPLKNPICDQREVELWSQAMAYLSENWV